jgi:2-oxo-3-hexenedioate decarboxylase
MDQARIVAIADRLIDAYEHAHTIEPITASDAGFGVDAAYAVLREISARRLAAGWQAGGRKIGFTNRTIWPRYGVDGPMWAHIYSQTVRHAPTGVATVSVSQFIQPRLEPEIVFGVNGPVPQHGDARAVLEAVDWMAAGFEIVQCHFPDWKFRAPDCTAAFGLHGALVIGPEMALTGATRDRLANALSEFEAALLRNGAVVDRGCGRDVLDSPALALQNLACVVASQPEAPRLTAGEIITTGTLTDAWPLTPGTRWRAEFGSLGLAGMELQIE